MVRKGKNLFELLQMRATGTVPQSARRAVARAPAVLLAGWGDAVRHWFGQLTGGGRRRGRGGAGHTGGLWITVGCLVCLATGFAIGRFTATPAKMSEPGSTPMRAQVPFEFPDVGETGGAAAWRAPDLQSADKEVESLSRFFLPVLAYTDTPANRDLANRAAHHLRVNGFPTARIKLFPRLNEGSEMLWAVLIYIQEKTEASAKTRAEEVIAKLKEVPPPSFEPRFRAKVVRLTADNLRQPK